MKRRSAVLVCGAVAWGLACGPPPSTFGFRNDGSMGDVGDAELQVSGLLASCAECDASAMGFEGEGSVVVAPGMAVSAAFGAGDLGHAQVELRLGSPDREDPVVAQALMGVGMVFGGGASLVGAHIGGVVGFELDEVTRLYTGVKVNPIGDGGGSTTIWTEEGIGFAARWELGNTGARMGVGVEGLAFVPVVDPYGDGVFFGAQAWISYAPGRRPLPVPEGREPLSEAEVFLATSPEWSSPSEIPSSSALRAHPRPSVAMLEVPPVTVPFAATTAATTRIFAVARGEVTQQLWRDVMGKDPSATKSAYTPVTRVSVFDAARFCNALSDREALPAAYVIEGDSLAVVPDSVGYRLPTAAEWRVAAVISADARPRVWHMGNSNGRTHAAADDDVPLGGFLGNVAEWAWDEELEAWVAIGGSYRSQPQAARVDAQDRLAPEGRYDDVGIRLVRTLPP